MLLLNESNRSNSPCHLPMVRLLFCQKLMAAVQMASPADFLVLSVKPFLVSLLFRDAFATGISADVAKILA
jgi:hypothetical protein